MVDGYEIEVPITLKGGREGEKVGKQIGEKIAAQLNKNLKSIGVGRGGAGGGAEGAVGLLGVSKGLTAVAAKLSIVGAAIGVAVGILAKSSPYLKGILDIFGRAFMIFFRPFGDFLATLLRPLAILMMKMAVAFLKWTRGTTAEKITTGTEAAIDWLFPGDLGSQFTAALAVGLESLKLVGSWLWGKITSVWNWTQDFAGWLWKQLISIWNWTFDFTGWLWIQLTSIWTWDWDFGAWLKGKIMDAIDITPGNIISRGFGGGGGGGKTTNVSKAVSLSPVFNIMGGFGATAVGMDDVFRFAGRKIAEELKQRGIL